MTSSKGKFLSVEGMLEKYRHKIYHVAVTFSDNRNDIEDFRQTITMHLLVRLREEFHRICGMKVVERDAFIHTIIANKARDEAKHKLRWKFTKEFKFDDIAGGVTRSFETGTRDEYVTVNDNEDAWHSEQCCTHDYDSRIAIEQALSKLPPKQSALIRLKFGIGVEETSNNRDRARAANCTREEAEREYQAALEALKPLLASAA